MRPLALVVGAALLVTGPAKGPPATATRRGEILVFAAASLTDALEEIGAAWETRTGTRVLFSFAGSTALARQIQAGAPADVFLSADPGRMDDLERAGLVRARDRVSLLSNRLAVIVPTSSSLVIEAPRDLEGVRRLALGDPEAVPAGVYARQWLEALGLWRRLRSRVVPTLDVRAALAAVESEAADAGIVYRTDARISPRVRVAFEVLPGEGPDIRYPAAVLAAAPSPRARDFLEYLLSPEAREVFLRLGFEPLWER
jgi:molybdate transport system substrate-binding protein